MRLVANLLIQNCKQLQMAETLPHGYSSESTQREISNEYQHDRILNLYNVKYLHFCALDESSLSIGSVNIFVDL